MKILIVGASGTIGAFVARAATCGSTSRTPARWPGGVFSVL